MTSLFSLRRPRNYLRTAARTGLLLVVVGCHASEVESAIERVFVGDVEIELAGAVGDAYRERLRLGLGSPFRLAELALHDSRLDPAERPGLARELVQRTAAGDAYEVIAASLISPVRPFTRGEADLAASHLQLVNAAVDQARDPRAGEVAVRLAYRLALAERTVDVSEYYAAVFAAALRRDRRLARSDAEELLDAARRRGADVTDLLPDWRRERRFAVERPLLGATAAATDAEAIRQLDRLLAGIRLIGLRPSGATGGDVRTEGFLSLTAAELIHGLADSLSTPPRAAAAVAASTVGTEMGLDEDPEWLDLLPRLSGEERLVAEWALRDTLSAPLRHALSRTLLRSAVGLRSLAQEEPWIATTSVHSAETLRARYGVRVAVDSGVPAAWLPFYLTALDAGISDLLEVVPRMSLIGLTFRITDRSSIAGALASHTGVTRTLEWPVVTGPGVLAHEVGHDLDWQASLRARRRGYASDAAAGTNSSLAQALAALAPTLPETPAGAAVRGPVRRVDHATRPAELFARSFEWFVVTRLAARGRSNGYLSSATDDVLTGHGSLRPPGFSRAFGSAIVLALRPVVPIPPAEAAGFLATYGPSRAPTATSVVRAILDSEVPGPPDAGAPLGPTIRTGGSTIARDRVLTELTRWMCEQEPAFADASLVDGYRSLAWKASSARARGIALEVASQVGGADAVRSMRRELYGPMWPRPAGDPADAEVLQSLLVELRGLDSAANALVTTWGGLLSDPPCARYQRSGPFSIFS